jgi:hypothetical protein
VKARAYDLWQYLDPEVITKPVLREPERPTLSDVLAPLLAEQRRVTAINNIRNKNAQGEFVGDRIEPTILPLPTILAMLTELEKTEYDFNLQMFRRELQKYDTQKLALRQFEADIMNTVDTAYQSILWDKDAPEIMNVYKAQFKLTDFAI